MTAVTAFEHRKDMLLSQLQEARDVQSAVLACTMALEQVACELAQDEADERARQRQQAVLALARCAPGLLQSARARGEIVLPEQQAAQEGGLSRAARGMQLTGVLLLTGLAVYQYVKGHSLLALLQAIGALLFVAGFMRTQGAPQEERQARGIPQVDAQAVVIQLTQLMEAADVCVSDLALLETGGAHARLSGTADDAMLDLLVALMEAKASGREAMAMRSLSLAEEYLHMLGIEVVPYDEERADLFDSLPTIGAARTVRPALVRDGRVMRRGVAAVPASQAGRSVGA